MAPWRAFFIRAVTAGSCITFVFQTLHSEQVFSNLAQCLLLSMDSAVISVFCRLVPTSYVARIKHFKACEVCFFDCASVPEGLVYLVQTPMPLKRKLHICGTCLYCRCCKLQVMDSRAGCWAFAMQFGWLCVCSKY